MKLLATLGKIAPSTKSSWPPAPEMARVPLLSAFTWAIQVNVNGVVDGDKVIQAADHPHIVGVINGYRHTLRIVIQVSYIFWVPAPNA